MNPGDFVLSAKGRDKGKIFIVVGREDEEYVLLCDGQIRKADKPKRKKTKHTVELDAADLFIAEKIANGGRATNNELRKAISSFRSAQIEAEGKEEYPWPKTTS